MGVLGDSSKVLETPSWSVLLVKCLYRHPLKSTDRLSYCRQTAQALLRRQSPALATQWITAQKGNGNGPQRHVLLRAGASSAAELLGHRGITQCGGTAFPGFFVLLSKTSTQYQENWARVAANNTSRPNQES